MRRQLVKIITLSFVAFWIVLSVFWLQTHQQKSQQDVKNAALDFHELILKKLQFFEKVFEFPNTTFNNSIKYSLPLLSEIMYQDNRPVGSWTAIELQKLAHKFNFSEILLLDSSKNILASSQYEEINTTSDHPLTKQSYIFKNMFGKDKFFSQTPVVDFQTGTLHLNGWYGPKLQPELLISVSINIRQFDSENKIPELVDHMFFEYFADIKKDRYGVAEFDLIFVKNNQYFSLIGSDSSLKTLDIERFPSTTKLSLHQRIISGVSVKPITTKTLDYADFVIIQSKHKLESHDQSFMNYWLTATGLLLILLVITLITLSTNFLSAIKNASLEIHHGLASIEEGDFKTEIQNVGTGDLADIAKHINETSKKLAENNLVHESYKQDMEKLVNDRTYALRREIEERTNIEAQIKEMSLTDHLTKSGNRRYFDQTLAAQFALFSRKKVPFSINLIDIDQFKQTNDIHGHPAGDAILIQLTRLIGTLIREYDYFCRIGGEEFAIILPETDLEGAKIFAQRVLEEIRTSTFIIDGGTLNTTVSIGVAEISPRDENEYALLKRADHALYKAKRSGRNRLEIQ